MANKVSQFELLLYMLTESVACYQAYEVRPFQ